MKDGQEEVSEPIMPGCAYVKSTVVEKIVPASWKMAVRQMRDSYVLVIEKGYDELGFGFASHTQNR